jgi:hypothetical protein
MLDAAHGRAIASRRVVRSKEALLLVLVCFVFMMDG